MSVENLEISGIRRNPEPHIDFSANPTGQSVYVDCRGGFGMVARRLNPDNTGMSPEQELENRIASVRFYKKHLPDLVPETQMVILQGYDNDPNTGKRSSVPVFARFTEKLDNIKHTSDLSRTEIAGDDELKGHIREINRKALRTMVFHGIMMDPDIMVGNGRDGSRKIICDPDWTKKACLRERARCSLVYSRNLLTTYIPIRQEVEHKTGEAKERLASVLVE